MNKGNHKPPTKAKAKDRKHTAAVLGALATVMGTMVLRHVAIRWGVKKLTGRELSWKETYALLLLVRNIGVVLEQGRRSDAEAYRALQKVINNEHS